MHIIIVIDSLAGGGAEKVMLTLLQTLQDLGNQCTLVLLSSACDYHVPNNVDVRRFDASAYWFLKPRAKAFSQYINLIEKEKGTASLLLSNLDKSNFLVAHINHPNSYYVVHNSVKDSLGVRSKSLFKWLKIRRALKSLSGKRLIAVSEGVKDGILTSSFITPASIEVIYNPVNIPDVKAASYVETPSIPNRPYFIHVGRVAKQKRHDVLFSALSQTHSGVDLVCLCRNVRKARRIAKRFGVEDRVIFPAFQQNPYPWIRQAQGLVLSSDFEGFGMVLVEAHICDTPVISTDCDYGPREILTGPLATGLVPVGDCSLLASQMDKLVASKALFLPSPILGCVEAKVVANQYLALANC